MPVFRSHLFNLFQPTKNDPEINSTSRLPDPVWSNNVILYFDLTELDSILLTLDPIQTRSTDPVNMSKSLTEQDHSDSHTENNYSQPDLAGNGETERNLQPDQLDQSQPFKILSEQSCLPLKQAYTYPELVNPESETANLQPKPVIPQSNLVFSHKKPANLHPETAKPLPGPSNPHSEPSNSYLDQANLHLKSANPRPELADLQQKSANTYSEATDLHLKLANPHLYPVNLHSEPSTSDLQLNSANPHPKPANPQARLVNPDSCNSHKRERKRPLKLEDYRTDQDYIPTKMKTSKQTSDSGNDHKGK